MNQNEPEWPKDQRPIQIQNDAHAESILRSSHSTNEQVGDAVRFLFHSPNPRLRMMARNVVMKND